VAGSSIMGFSVGGYHTRLDAYTPTHRFIGLIDPSSRKDHLTRTYSKNVAMLWGSRDQVATFWEERFKKLEAAILNGGGFSERLKLDHSKFPRSSWIGSSRGCPEPGYLRPASYRNRTRRFASSIHTSIRLAVATSPCWSQTTCTSRSRETSCWLSSRSSASMSATVTWSASLSATRCSRPICPIERSVVLPSLRTHSAIGSVVA
jgi:hypothetical protein